MELISIDNNQSFISFNAGTENCILSNASFSCFIEEGLLTVAPLGEGFKYRFQGLFSEVLIDGVSHSTPEACMSALGWLSVSAAISDLQAELDTLKKSVVYGSI